MTHWAPRVGDFPDTPLFVYVSCEVEVEVKIPTVEQQATGENITVNNWQVFLTFFSTFYMQFRKCFAQANKYNKQNKPQTFQVNYWTLDLQEIEFTSHVICKYGNGQIHCCLATSSYIFIH